MNNCSRFPAFVFFLLTFVATSCSNRNDHIRFLTENGIRETEKVPADYSGGNGWKQLGGDYVYFLDLFDAKNDPQMIYIVANKKENKLIGLLHVNPFIMPSAVAKGVNPATVVTNYEEMNSRDIAKANDMSEFNALLKNIPEMKDFKWKNTLQNTIASGIILKTQFIYVAKKSTDEKLFAFSAQPVFTDHDQQLREIFLDDYTLYHRDVQRLNRSVEMGQFITALGFHYETEGTGVVNHTYKKFYIDDLLTNDPIDFSGKGKMFFFIPFKSFTRPRTKEESPNYTPAIETYEYTTTADQDGFPVFKRNTHFASLLQAQNLND